MEFIVSDSERRGKKVEAFAVRVSSKMKKAQSSRLEDAVLLWVDQHTKSSSSSRLPHNNISQCIFTRHNRRFSLSGRADLCCNFTSFFVCYYFDFSLYDFNVAWRIHDRRHCFFFELLCNVLLGALKAAVGRSEIFWLLVHTYAWLFGGDVFIMTRQKTKQQQPGREYTTALPVLHIITVPGAENRIVNFNFYTSYCYGVEWTWTSSKERSCVSCVEYSWKKFENWNSWHFFVPAGIATAAATRWLHTV